MSEDLSFEQLSVSSNDSWALLDVEKPGLTSPGNVDLFVIDGHNQDVCFLCNQPLSDARFPCPSCEVCLICAHCKETYDLHRAPVCCHTLTADAEVSMFYFDDSHEEDVLIMDSKDRSSFGEVHHPVPDLGQLINSTEFVQSSLAKPDSEIPKSQLPLEASEFPRHRDSDYRSLTDQVRDALRLHETDVDISDAAPVAPTASEGPLGVQNTPSEASRIKLILSPQLWSQSDNISSNLSSNNGIPVPRLSATPVLRTAIQVVRSSCNSSECRTSSSSSSSRSPPSLSSSPMNVAGKILKSVALHSASTMNPFDCMPVEAFDASFIATKPTESRSSPERQPGTPPSSVTTGADDRLTNARDFVTRFVWDHEKIQTLVKPKPVPKSVLEQSAYSLR